MRKIRKEMSDEGDLLNEFPAETRLTVYRRRDIYRTAVNWPDSGPALMWGNGHLFYVFNDLSYYESLVCYIESFLNLRS